LYPQVRASYIDPDISDSSFSVSAFSKMGELAVHRPETASGSSGDLPGFMPARTANYTPRKKTQTLYVTVKLPHRGEQKSRAETLRKRKIRGGSPLQMLVKREGRAPRYNVGDSVYANVPRTFFPLNCFVK
jgi:hypothetical protein